MTRLEASGEPSMEEILASIRKIIAEEPPGSRAAPPPRAAQPAQAAAPAAAPASIDRSLFAREAPHVAKSAAASASVAVDRPDRSLQEAPPSGRDTAKPSNASPSAVSVEAQLSDLLDSAEMTGNQSATGASGRLGDQASRAESTPSARVQPRFTISRDGFAPASPAKELAADPFEFDLGPSPFSKREPAAPAPQADPPAAASKWQPSSSASYDYGKRFQDDDRPASSKAELKAQPQPAPQPAPMLKPTVSPSAAPSIAATMPPHAHESKPGFSAHDQVAAAAFARSVEIMSRRSGQRSVHDVVTEAVNAAMSKPAKFSAFEVGETPVAVEVDDSLTWDQQLAVRGAGSGGGANVPAVRRDGENGLRTMEDTVADLLRPMLKAWLAENMPRIIERALRREISDMDGSTRHQHKTAAE